MDKPAYDKRAAQEARYAVAGLTERVTLRFSPATRQMLVDIQDVYERDRIIRQALEMASAVVYQIQRPDGDGAGWVDETGLWYHSRQEAIDMARRYPGRRVVARGSRVVWRPD